MHLAAARCFYLSGTVGKQIKLDYMTLCLSFGLVSFAIHKVSESYIKTIDKILVNVYNGIIGGGCCE